MKLVLVSIFLLSAYCAAKDAVNIRGDSIMNARAMFVAGSPPKGPEECAKAWGTAFESCEIDVGQTPKPATCKAKLPLVCEATQACKNHWKDCTSNLKAARCTSPGSCMPFDPKVCKVSWNKCMNPKGKCKDVPTGCKYSIACQEHWMKCAQAKAAAKKCNDALEKATQCKDYTKCKKESTQQPCTKSEACKKAEATIKENEECKNAQTMNQCEGPDVCADVGNNVAEHIESPIIERAVDHIKAAYDKTIAAGKQSRIKGTPWCKDLVIIEATCAKDCRQDECKNDLEDCQIAFLDCQMSPDKTACGKLPASCNQGTPSLLQHSLEKQDHQWQYTTGAASKTTKSSCMYMWNSCQTPSAAKVIRPSNAGKTDSNEPKKQKKL